MADKNPAKQRQYAREHNQRARSLTGKLAERVADIADLPEPPDTEMILKLLGQEARNGHVPAMKILLEEYRRADDDRDTSTYPLDSIDELSQRRRA